MLAKLSGEMKNQTTLAILGDAGTATMENACQKAHAANIPILTIMQLLMTYGPQVWSILSVVLTALKAPGGVNWQAITELVTKEGPTVYAIVTVICKALGVGIPAGVIPT